ncbi:flagellar biosynthetic protein FliR [Shigella flexneri]
MVDFTAGRGTFPHPASLVVNRLEQQCVSALTKTGSLIFLNGLTSALPLITLLLTLNLALGLLNRMAPQLSIFVIGFPLVPLSVSL